MKQNGYLYRNLCGIGAALICLLLLLPALPFRTVEAQSQPLNDTSGEHETDAKIQVFFDALMKGESSSAFDELFRQGTFKSPIEKEQASTMMRGRLGEASVRLGEILDYKIYDTKRIDEDIVLSRYILKFEDGPTLWTFMFYRKPTAAGITNDNPWRLVAINFDGDLRLLLQ